LTHTAEVSLTSQFPTLQKITEILRCSHIPL